MAGQEQSPESSASENGLLEKRLQQLAMDGIGSQAPQQEELRPLKHDGHAELERIRRIANGQETGPSEEEGALDVLGSERRVRAPLPREEREQEKGLHQKLRERRRAARQQQEQRDPPPPLAEPTERVLPVMPRPTETRNPSERTAPMGRSNRPPQNGQRPRTPFGQRHEAAANDHDDEQRISCPVCGGLMFAERDGYKWVQGERKPCKIQNLTCVPCNNEFKKQEGATLAQIALGREGVRRMDKFQWTCDQIDLERYREDLEAAVEAYKEVYDRNVFQVMLSHGQAQPNGLTWKDGVFPRIQFQTSRDNDQRTLLKVEEILRGQIPHGLEMELNDSQKEVTEAYKRMRRMQGRLEVAPRIKADLEAKLAERANSASEVEGS